MMARLTTQVGVAQHTTQLSVALLKPTKAAPPDRRHGAHPWGNGQVRFRRHQEHHNAGDQGCNDKYRERAWAARIHRPLGNPFAEIVVHVADFNEPFLSDDLDRVRQGRCAREDRPDVPGQS